MSRKDRDKRYHASHARIDFYLGKGEKQLLVWAAQTRGMSQREYILWLVKQDVDLLCADGYIAPPAAEEAEEEEAAEQ